MTRQQLIERILRQVYGGQPSDDSNITDNLVNQFINDGIAIAAKQNYKEAIQIDGIGYINNSFYTTFKGLSVSADENFTWKITLPQLPIGLGRNEGVRSLLFKSENNKISLDCIPMSANEVTIFRNMRAIPNKVMYYSEGVDLFVYTTILLSDYTASVTMVSGGDSSDLTSTLILPDDYVNIVIDYCTKMLFLQKAQPSDPANDGVQNQ
jgi:hypothetical protein